MIFGEVAVAEAAGSILAHSVQAGPRTFRKGIRLDPESVEALAAAGISHVAVARLMPGDVHEDEAARRVGAALAQATLHAGPPGTGRVNLFAATAGLVAVDRACIDALNRIDPAVTLATLAEDAPVVAGQMVATVKIIPYAVREATMTRVEALLAGNPPLAVAPFRAWRIGLIQTGVAGLKASVLAKTRRSLDQRLAPSGSAVAIETRVSHETGELAAALVPVAQEADLVIVFGASAVVDDADVVPEAIRQAGGVVRHVGMPVDPGNLLVLGALDGKTVVGAPGCARSPRENGFDWVLNRLLADLEVTPEYIAGLGVGGLLMEIEARPQPRARTSADEGRSTNPAPTAVAAGADGPEMAQPRVAAVILAAGRSSRMAGPNKLLETVGGRPMVRAVAEAALASGAAEVMVVVGHQADRVADALAGLDVGIVANPDFAAGLSTSLRAGIAALPPHADAAVILLGDMPFVTPETIDRLIARHAAGDAAIVAAANEGRPGNPVLWDRRFFAELAAVTGDTGGRAILARHAAEVAQVEAGEAAALDIDTPDALRAARRSARAEA